MRELTCDDSADHVQLIRDWVADAGQSRAVMETVWQATHGAAYVPSVENYRDAVRLVVSHLWDKGEVREPLWRGLTDRLSFDATPIGARLTDALAFHVAQMYGVASLGWAVCMDPSWLAFGDPAVGKSDRRTPASALTSITGIAKGTHPLSRAEFPFYVMPELREKAPGPELGDSELDVDAIRTARGTRKAGLFKREDIVWNVPAVEPSGERVKVAPFWPEAKKLTIAQLLPGAIPSTLAPDYTHELWLDEAAEHQWGTERFTAFEAALARQPGIDRAFHEDREIIHVYAPTLTNDHVLEAARKAARRP